MNRADFQRLANDRLADAKVLLAGRRWAGAYYLTGYAVEAALKAGIAKLIPAEEFPDKTLADKCWTHNLPQLLGLAGLKDDFAAAWQADIDLKDNWDIVKEWNESSRYRRRTRTQAEELYEAVTDRKHGVFPWLKLHC